MTRRLPATATFLVVTLIVMACVAGRATAEVRLERLDDRVAVAVDGQPFTAYIFSGHRKPILFPVNGPGGIGLTRQHPIVAGVAGEAKDHPHQESVWFTHGIVNGHDFWGSHPLAGRPDLRDGPRVEHVKIERTQSGREGVLETASRWLAADGAVVCTDTRRIVFGTEGGARTIDHAITIHADHGPVTFGDTKEGTFGLRLHSALQPTDAHGSSGATGRIVNSEGDVQEAVWGKQARWVDYSGTIDGRKMGVAILDHPTNLRHPTHWHARDYGLFAANPFGLHDFTGSEPGTGAYTIPSGGSLTLRHLVVLHDGDAEAADIEGHWKRWSGMTSGAGKAVP